MTLIDFDCLFEAYLRNRLSSDLKGKCPEDVEKLIPEIYDDWLSTELAEYGISPRAYFEKLKTEGELAEYIKECIKQDEDISEILLDYIDDSAVNALIEALGNPKYAGIAAAMLKECGTTKADGKLIELLSESDDEAVVEIACEILADNHEGIADILLKRIAGEDEKVQERYLDILYRYGGREEILDWLIKFLNKGNDCMLYASYIGAYGMEEAVDDLIYYLRKNETNRYEYLEIRNAVERLGGEIPEELTKE